MKKLKLNVNPVGAGFHTRPIKENSGITLIALIITIIVMLILVGVTINVALNGGLFTKASDASKQMQVEADRETLLSAVVAAIGNDGKVVLEDIELPTGWEESNGTYTSPKGNSFTVDENGKITKKEESATIPQEPEEEQPILTASQMNVSKYSDRTIIALNMTFQNDEQCYKIAEKAYQLDWENNYTLDQNLIIYYYELNDNEEPDPSLTIESTGKTREELFLENTEKENLNEATEYMLSKVATYTITRPDGTAFTCEGITLNGMSNPPEGTGYGKDEEQYPFYVAEQLGTYEITITVGEYTLTDTITIEEF